MVYLAVALSAALGGFVQSITGFGAAVVMMTILPYFFTMAVAPSVSTSICLGLTVTLAWKLRKSIDLKLTLPPTLLYAAASVTAIRFIGSMDLRVMTMVFGAFLMLLGAYLLLTEKKALHRLKAGLELCVIDHYNGTKRSVKTLSGGESFQASLSLALGLSDEIQSYAGGIRMDSMFVDEGFGSLDEDALEQALKALLQLTEGNRLVGIISHVSELKDQIDKKIIVTKQRTPEGVSSVARVE